MRTLIYQLIGAALGFFVCAVTFDVTEFSHPKLIMIGSMVAGAILLGQGALNDKGR